MEGSAADGRSVTDRQPALRKTSLEGLRPVAIDLTGCKKKPVLGDSVLGGICSPGCSPGLASSPGAPRVTISNASKNRDIAKIEAPSKIGDFYDFGGIIGRGGFGTVSEILHAKTFQPFAGKVVEKACFESIADSEELFRKVMGVLLNYEHPHLVKMLHIFEDDMNYYAVMDLCQGGTLRSFIRNAARAQLPLPGRVIEDILEQTISAIGALHRLQIIHRDIKPDNVMLLRSADITELTSGLKKIKVCLVDFDMCSFLDDQGEMISTMLEGTPGYLAPELLVTQRYTAMSDIFSFGCLSYYVLKREEPCPELSIGGMPSIEMVSTLDQWLQDTLWLSTEAERVAVPAAVDAGPANSGGSCGTSITASPPGSPSSAGSSLIPSLIPGSEPCYEGIPVRLWRLLAWCLEKDPARRPASADAVMSSGLLRGEGNTPKTAKKDKSPSSKLTRSESGGTSKVSIGDLLKMKAPARS